jgi:hypothetical protein
MNVKATDVADFLRLLSLLGEDGLEKVLEEDRPASIALLQAMGQFIIVSSGNLNKLYEKITALELREKYKTQEDGAVVVTHVKHSYGPDIVLTKENGEAIADFEVKTSFVDCAKVYHSNWPFTIDPYLCSQYKEAARDKVKNASLLLEIEQKMILSLYKKMKNGVTLFVARSIEGKLNEYEVDGLFIALFCIKKVLTSIGGTVNFGCDRCTSCHHYHKMLHLQQCAQRVVQDQTLRASPQLSCLSEEEWKLALKRIPAQKECEKFNKK